MAYISVLLMFFAIIWGIHKIMEVPTPLREQLKSMANEKAGQNQTKNQNTASWVKSHEAVF